MWCLANVASMDQPAYSRICLIVNPALSAADVDASCALWAVNTFVLIPALIIHDFIHLRNLPALVVWYGLMQVINSFVTSPLVGFQCFHTQIFLSWGYSCSSIKVDFILSLLCFMILSWNLILLLCSTILAASNKCNDYTLCAVTIKKATQQSFEKDLLMIVLHYCSSF